jgi:hypothetical protein
MGRYGDVDFADGVSAALGWLSQSLTYEGLLDGVPTAEMTGKRSHRHGSGTATRAGGPTHTTRWSSSLGRSNFPCGMATRSGNAPFCRVCSAPPST